MGTYDEDLTDDQIAYLHERAATRREIWREHMSFIDAQGLMPSQAELLAELQALPPYPEDHWLCFVNAGFTIQDAKALYDRGLIDTAMQMGMPVARITSWIKHDGPAAPVDGEQRVQVKWKDPVEEGVTTQRAGALNWAAIAAYRLAPNPAAPGE